MANQAIDATLGKMMIDIKYTYQEETTLAWYGDIWNQGEKIVRNRYRSTNTRYIIDAASSKLVFQSTSMLSPAFGNVVFRAGNVSTFISSSGVETIAWGTPAAWWNASFRTFINIYIQEINSNHNVIHGNLEKCIQHVIFILEFNVPVHDRLFGAKT